MSLETNKRVGDWARWYHYHKDQVGRSEDLRKHQEFYSRAIDGLLEITALLARDVQMLEQRGDSGVPTIVLPTGVKFNEKIRA